MEYFIKNSVIDIFVRLLKVHIIIILKVLDGVFIVIHERCETCVDWSVPIMSLSSVSGTPAIVARFLSASIVA